MSTAYRIVSVILAFSCLVFGGWYIGTLRSQVLEAQEATKTARQELKRTQATMVLRERQRAVTARETALAQESLSTAIKANQDWGDTPVPQEVQDAVCAHLACSSGPGGLRSP